MRCLIFMIATFVIISSPYAQFDILIFELTLYIPQPGDFYPLDAASIYSQNILGNEAKEIIACDYSRVIIYDAINGDRLWTGPDAPMNRDLIFRDIDNDGYLEIAEIDEEGVSLIDVVGDSVIWSDKSRHFNKGCYTLDDINADGHQDIAVVRRENLRDDLAPDTAWLDIFLGPDYQRAGQIYFLLVGSNQGRCVRQEYPTGVAFGEVSGEQGMSGRIFVFTENGYDSTYIDNPYSWFRNGYDGKAWIFDSENLLLIDTIETGKVESHAIKQHEGNTYLYTLSGTLDQLFVRPDTDNSGVVAGEYVKCLSADSLIGTHTLWSVDTSYEWWSDWHFEKIDDFSESNPGDELCYTLLDTITLVSFPELEPIWHRGTRINLKAPLFSFHPTSLFDRPQILLGDPLSQQPSLMFSSSDGRMSARFVDQTLKPTIVDDLNGDGEDEAASIIAAGSLIFIGLAVKYPSDIFNESPMPQASFQLYANYPNPFNAQTNITYSLAEPGQVTLTIYNLLGQKVATLFDGVQTAGEHKLIWDATEMKSGLYFSRIENGKINQTVKMILLR